jgi:hypothetical protein
MSDTPETDALWREMTTGNYQPSWWVAAERMRDHAKRLERQRDEARDAIPAGEWVAYKDHQKIHDAASRLLVAINKQLPIGCFILINSEYHRLQNAIYGREGAK